ncbi:MAG: mechanosensitive ion channel family protein [Myxococcales bacterium]|nr:mechanosensitive ion channel family protein [Myxococcales bacterium]MCB9538675.1 mechanosensitive ion channel family protein [Myxococcales bacterium]
MGEVLDRLADRFGPEAIAAWLSAKLPDLLVALATFAVFYLLWRLVDRAIKVVAHRTAADITARSFIEATAKYVLLTVGTVAALGQVGIDTASIIASLGILGLTIGFAARDALSNIISGIFIFWDRPFVLGDLVEIDGHYGRVDAITMRSTRVVTVDGRMLAIPNNAVVNSTVASYTNFPHLRLDVDVTVGTGEDLGRVRRLLLAVVEGDARYLTEPAPAVVVTALNDYNVAVQLRAWIDDERQHTALRVELRERMFEALRGADVEMPFETFSVDPTVLRSVAPGGDEAEDAEGRAASGA